jgi:hypothetical protein
VPRRGRAGTEQARTADVMMFNSAHTLHGPRGSTRRVPSHPYAGKLRAVLVLAALCAACNPDAAGDTGAIELGAADERGRGGTVVADTFILGIDDLYVEMPEDPEPPPVIYHDLTRHDWYRRGEPLRHAGRDFVPRRVAPANAVELEPAGEYGGVRYYRRVHGGEDSLFVPVHERYWLVFDPGPADTITN